VSLRQFKQIQLSNAIIELLKAIFDLLITPFAALYRLIACGEQHEFANMLVPVQHDRVGGINHNVVLSQLRFIAGLFGKADPVDHTRGLDGLQPVAEKQIWFASKDRPCKVFDSHYEIWINTHTYKQTSSRQQEVLHSDGTKTTEWIPVMKWLPENA